jgi:tripartite-type tricarboxylate transporter receptor subunit TctC
MVPRGQPEGLPRRLVLVEPTRRVLLRVALQLIASTAVGGVAAAADTPAPNFPTRSVRLIVNFPAGSGTADAVARALCEYFTRKWGQPITVDNVPGSTGVVGASTAYRAPPDGYTLLVTPAGALTVAQHLQKLDYDPDRFVPITMLETSPIVLVASPHLPVNNIAELIAYARAHPGQLRVANHGIGSSSHLAAQWLASLAQIQIFNVPFRGSVAALQALGDGRVDVLFDNLGSSLQPIRNNEVKALAVASAKPEPLLPNVLTIAETLPGFATSSWVALVAPPDTPPSLVQWLSSQFAEALREPLIEKTLADLACEPGGWTPQATTAFIRDESERWKSVIREAKISLQ